MNALYIELLQAFGLIALLIALNALLVAGDFGLIKLHFARFEGRLSEKKELPRALAALLNDVNQTSRAIRLGINLTTICLGIVLVSPLRILGETAPFAADWLRTLTVVLAFLMAVTVHFLIGELVPRALALNYPRKALGAACGPIFLVRFLTRGFVRMLSRFTRRVFRLLRVDAELEANLIDVEVQLRSLLQGGEEISPIMTKILRNAVALRNRVVQDVLLPRNRIQYFDLMDGNAANIEIARKSGHTRFPLCDGDLDHCIGVIHIKDIFRSRGKWEELDFRKIKRDILRFSLDDPLETVLQRLLAQKRHMALVMDEFGGAVGAITLEDVLEELVGEIQDEFDREETQIQPLPGGEYAIDGLTPVHDVAEELGIEIENPEVSTFGGYITSELGRMPKENTVVRIERLEIRITGANEKRVTSARVRILPPQDQEITNES